MCCAYCLPVLLLCHIRVLAMYIYRMHGHFFLLCDGYFLLIFCTCFGFFTECRYFWCNASCTVALAGVSMAFIFTNRAVVFSLRLLILGYVDLFSLPLLPDAQIDF